VSEREKKSLTQINWRKKTLKNEENFIEKNERLKRHTAQLSIKREREIRRERKAQKISSPKMCERNLRSVYVEPCDREKVLSETRVALEREEAKKEEKKDKKKIVKSPLASHFGVNLFL
jgi:hypothetical protein